MATINDIITDSKNLLRSLRKMEKERDKRIEKIQRNPDFSKEGKQKLIDSERAFFKQDSDRLRARLAENYADGKRVLAADNRHLDNRFIDSNFYSFTACLSTPEDFAEYAKMCASSPAKLYYLKNLAHQRGYRLNVGADRADKMKAWDSINELLTQGFKASDPFADVALGDTISSLEQTFEPLDSNSISCVANTIESTIAHDLQSAYTAQNNTETDGQFYHGFTGQPQQKADITASEAFGSVREITGQYNAPQREKRILQSLADVLDSKTLSERIDSDSVKLASDYYRKAGHNDKADELQRVATLMLKDGYAYKNEPGTETEPDREGTHTAFKTMVKEMEMKRLEAEQKATDSDG